jgi:hypothetical protein
MSGKPSTTIAFEKHYNPALQLKREDFIEEISKKVPPKPAEMEQILSYNRGLTP